MRVEKLEEKEAAGLRAIGFTIDDEGEAAMFETDALTINITRPHRADEFSVYIERDPFSTILD